MPSRIMVLPSKIFDHIRIVELPEDFDEHEVYRHITGIIAGVQEDNPDCTWEQVADALEDHGITPMDVILGPELLCQHE